MKVKALQEGSCLLFQLLTSVGNDLDVGFAMVRKF